MVQKRAPSASEVVLLKDGDFETSFGEASSCCYASCPSTDNNGSLLSLLLRHGGNFGQYALGETKTTFWSGSENVQVMTPCSFRVPDAEAASGRLHQRNPPRKATKSLKHHDSHLLNRGRFLERSKACYIQMILYLISEAEQSGISNSIYKRGTYRQSPQTPMHGVNGALGFIQSIPSNSQPPQLRHCCSASFDLVPRSPEHPTNLDVAFHSNAHGSSRF